MLKVEKRPRHCVEQVETGKLKTGKLKIRLASKGRHSIILMQHDDLVVTNIFVTTFYLFLLTKKRKNQNCTRNLQTSIDSFYFSVEAKEPPAPTHFSLLSKTKLSCLTKQTYVRDFHFESVRIRTFLRVAFYCKIQSAFHITDF